MGYGLSSSGVEVVDGRKEGEGGHTLLVAAQVEGREADVADCEFLGSCGSCQYPTPESHQRPKGATGLRTGVEGRLQDSHAIVLCTMIVSLSPNPRPPVLPAHAPNRSIPPL